MRLNGQLLLAFQSLFIGRFTLAVDVWCGKAYRPSDPAIDLGGRLNPPVRSLSPLLDLQIRPRVQPYLETDVTASFIVDAPVSYVHGQPYNSTTFDQQKNESLKLFPSVAEVKTLSFNVTRADSGLRLISHATVKVNSTGTLFDFDLSGFRPRYEPYDVSIVATAPNGQVYKASTQTLRLPSRTDGGSVTKVDSLYGALLVGTSTKSSNVAPLFPYSYYFDGKWLAESPTNMAVLKDHGYNVLHIIPAGGLGYDFEQLDGWLDQAQLLGLWIMYDMRGQYQNATGVEWQINRLKARPNILLWYTADEPDGHVDALNAPKRAYDQIKSLDPYHPVSLCLNCENYHYQEYSAGADIILSDVYPIGTNTSWSTQYNTVCNSTYGSCGCDNCHGHNDLSNVYARLDTYTTYQSQLGLPPKVLWGTPQAFGNSGFWKQTPTPDEEVAMTMLSVNHGAKGILMWYFPTTPDLTAVTTRLAKVLTGTCAKYVLGAELTGGLRVGGAGTIDASAWRAGDSLLLSIVNSAHEDTSEIVSVYLPAGIVARDITSVLWGDGWWSLRNAGDGFVVKRWGVHGLSTAILVIGLQPQLLGSGGDVLADA